MKGYRLYRDGKWTEFLNPAEIMAFSAFVIDSFWPMWIWCWRRNEVNKTIEIYEHQTTGY